MIVDIPLGAAVEAQSNPTISSIDEPATLNDFEGPTVLISAIAEPNTEAPVEGPSNLQLTNETTTPQIEEELPYYIYIYYYYYIYINSHISTLIANQMTQAAMLPEISISVSRFSSNNFCKNTKGLHE